MPSHPPVALVPWSWSSETSFYQPPSPLPSEPPGTLIRIQHMAPIVPIPKGATAWRILYYSRSIVGSDIAVSGVLVLPARPAPPGGWPLVSYAHATTGIATACAPSRFAYLGWITDLGGLLHAGYAVVATDYPGLGTPGVHPYLVGVSEARSVLDAARAAREVPGVDISNRVVVLGYSQGGQAVLFAGQLAASYAPDIDLLGVIALSPGIAIPELISHLSSSASMNGFFVTVAYAWSHTYLDLPITSLLRPAAMALIGNVDTQCENGLVKTYSSLQSSQVEQPDLAANEPWQRYLIENDPGHSPSHAPILVAQGEQDPLVPYQLTESFAQMACAREHDHVRLMLFSGAGHYTVTLDSRSAVLKWIRNRFAGIPIRHGCPGVPPPPGGVVPSV